MITGALQDAKTGIIVALVGILIAIVIETKPDLTPLLKILSYAIISAGIMMILNSIFRGPHVDEKNVWKTPRKMMKKKLRHEV